MCYNHTGSKFGKGNVMKRARITAVLLTMALLLTACGTKQEGQSATQPEAQAA
jgi:starvation-inducible outer membrane lipoprotein